METGLNLIGQTEAAQTIHSGQQALEATAHNIAVAVEAADLVLQDAATFLQPLVSTATGSLLTSTPNHLQGTTTGGDEAAASDARISSSSTVQDLQSAAAAPQLSTTHDPLPSTDPAVPWQNEIEGNQGLQNLFLYPSDEAMILDVINSIDFRALIQSAKNAVSQEELLTHSAEILDDLALVLSVRKVFLLPLVRKSISFPPNLRFLLKRNSLWKAQFLMN